MGTVRCSLRLFSHQLKISLPSLILALACTVQFYTRGRTQHNYNGTADAIGKKLEVGGILAEIEKKVPQFHGSEADDGTRSWVVIKAILVHEAGDTAVGGPPARPMPSLEPVGESTSQTPTLRMPTSLSAAESARPALPTRPKPPPSSKVKSTHQAQAHPTPGYQSSLEQTFAFCR